MKQATVRIYNVLDLSFEIFMDGVCSVGAVTFIRDKIPIKLSNIVGPVMSFSE